MELREPAFRKRPKRLNPINMAFAIRKLIGSMVDSVMLLVAQVYKAIVSTPPIGVDDAIRIHTATYDALQRGFRAIRDDFGVYFTPSFKETKTGVFLYAPRPRLPLIRFPPK